MINSRRYLLVLLSLPTLGLAAECEVEGSVSAYASGDAAITFGAESSDLCVDFCIPEMALQFISNAQAGSCIEEGFTTVVIESKEVELVGSPMPINVAIYAAPEESESAASSSCEEGSISAYAAGEDAVESFGVETEGDSSDYCLDFCIPEAVLQFVPNAVAGVCASEGYTAIVQSSMEVQMPGSPVPLFVTLYSKSGAAPTDTSTSTNETDTTAVAIDQWDYPNPSSFEGPCVDCQEYVALSASKKLDRIWNKIMAYQYDELPTNWLYTRTNPTVTEMINNFPDKSRVNMVFDRVSDERPPNFPRLLHEYGSIAKIAFVPTSSNNNNNFTGLYKEGNDNGIIRITFCAPFNGARSGQRVPLAFAAKFFRDGIHSSNIPTCEGPDREWNGRNPKGFSVFQHLLHTSSIIPPPIDTFFANAQNGTGPLSIGDNTWWNKDGSAVTDPFSPLIIHFFPNDALNTKDAYEEDFRLELPELPINSTLYTAYTPVDDEGNPTICICHSTPEGDIPCFNRESIIGNCNLIELGSIVTRSEFVHSSYGDNGVLFKHYRSCQEDRKYCTYNQPIPEIDSTFTKSSDRNGTCVSRRRVNNYDDETCPFLARNGNHDNAIEGMELLETKDYCSTPDEHDLEKMCPFAKALHPSFSSSGVPYPISNDEHLRSCDILNTGSGVVAVAATSNSSSSSSLSAFDPLTVVSIACCRVINEYFVESTRDLALQSLCNMDDCYEQFDLAFPEVDLEVECADVDPVSECKFDLRAGPSMIPINLGFVTEECCTASQMHAGGEDTLETVCEDSSCIFAYASLFQQGQAFTNPGSTDTLMDVCMKMQENEEEEGETTPPVDEEMEGPEPPEDSATIERTGGAETKPEPSEPAPSDEEYGTSGASHRMGSLVLLVLPLLISLI